jgi:tripartite-type tricarboxylate transporter receptor subunit TctC
MQNHKGWVVAAGIVVVLGMGAKAQAADAVADFYKGKTLKIVVSTSAGGLYDTYARLMARHWGKYIPGNPTIVVENMPGASGLTGANFIANNAPKDGTIVGSVQSNIPTAEALRMEGVRFKANDQAWIGSISEETFISYILSRVPVYHLDETKTREIVVGGPSLGSASVDMAIIARKLFGFKLKIVTGYPGSTEVKLAMEKGELDGTFGNGWGALKTDQPDWLRDKYVRILVQHGLTRNKELPDVPLLLDWAKTTEDQQLLQILMARTAFAKPYFAPPGTPADRVNALRRAFDKTVADKDFLAEANKLHANPDNPMTGENVAATVAKLSEFPPSVVDRINAMFAEFRANR